MEKNNEIEEQKKYLVNKMTRWYDQSNVIFEMFFLALRRREFVVLTPKMLKNFSSFAGIRCLSCVSTDGLKFNLHNIKYVQENNPVQLYYSLTTYEKGLPRFNNVFRFRTTQVEEWKKEHHKHIISYDMLIDIDSPDISSMDTAKEDCYKIMNVLSQHGLKYYVRFSGMGYHIIVPHECFAHLNYHFNPHNDIENSIYILFNDITEWLHDTVSEFVDTGLHDSRRITKVPYSLAMYQNGTFVCWPFKTRQEFIKHNYKDYRIDTYCKFKGEQPLYRRGQGIFNPDWSKEGINKLVKEVKQHVTKKKNTRR